jgi:SAM-dependent methyltransferase
MTTADKYDRLAECFSDHDYADAELYADRRAAAIVSLGPSLRPGATVVDLGCGDGIMAGPLEARGLRYVAGVDASEQMVAAASRRHPGLTFVAARSEDYEPPEPVDLTICLRAFYYPEDRVAFFSRVAGYTRVRFVFDFRQAAHPADTVVRDLQAAGFTRIQLRPFFTPQQRSLPGIALPLVSAVERTGPIALALSRRAGRVFCSAAV